MNDFLKGAPVGVEILERLKNAIADADRKPTLAIVRMGAREDDLAYERSIIKKASACGIQVQNVALPEETAPAEAKIIIEELNRDGDIDGVLVFRPMPDSKVEEMICSTLAAEKDIDGITQASMAGVFTGKKSGFPPCTAEACIKMLDYYGFDIAGKNAVIIGRSMVIGKPVAMLLLERDATVTICHSKTKGLRDIVKAADIVIAAVGQKGFLTDEFVKEDQIIIDVGINFDLQGSIFGDVQTNTVADIVKAISPVPGGVGEVTTSLLLAHVAEAAERNRTNEKPVY